MGKLVLVICVLMAHFTVKGQCGWFDRGEKLADKALTHISKSNFKKAENKLRKCLYKFPKCYKCHLAYVDLAYKRKSYDSALNLINNALLIWPGDKELICGQFNVLNILLESSIKNSDYRKALSLISDIEAIDGKKCRNDSSWMREENLNLFFNSDSSISHYYSFKKFFLLFDMAEKEFRAGHYSEAKHILSALISSNLAPIGREGVNAKQWAAYRLCEINFSERDYHAARTIAQMLLEKKYQPQATTAIICKCDSALADSAKRSGDLKLETDYLEHFKKFCKGFDADYYNQICIYQAQEFLKDKKNADKQNLAVEYINQIDCPEKDGGRICYQVRTVRREAYLNLADLIKNTNKKKALDYLTLVLVDFPNDTASLRLKAEISYKLGAELKAKGEYELAIAFLSDAENDFEYGVKSTYLIGKIYENAFQIDSAEKYMDKVLRKSGGGEINTYKSYSSYEKARYQTIRGNTELAKKFLPDYCDENYFKLRRKAWGDGAFNNLRNDVEFQYWLVGYRRISFSDFRVQTDLDQDAEWELEPNGSEYYFYVINSNKDTFESGLSKNLIANSGWKYDLFWPGSFCIKQFSNPLIYVNLNIYVFDSDDIGWGKTKGIGVNDDSIFHTEYTLQKLCRIDTNITLKRYYKNEHEVRVMFHVEDNYSLDEKVIIPEFSPSLFAIIVDAAKCVFYWRMPPLPLLIFEIGKAVLVESKFENNEKGIKEAIINYFESKLPPKIYEGIILGNFVNCIKGIIDTLKENGWNKEMF